MSTKPKPTTSQVKETLQARAQAQFAQCQARYATKLVFTAVTVGVAICAYLVMKDFGLLWYLGVVVLLGVVMYGVLMRTFPTQGEQIRVAALMLRALDNPAVIKLSSSSKVILREGDTDLVLSPMFRNVWGSTFCPYLTEKHNEALEALHAAEERQHLEDLAAQARDHVRRKQLDAQRTGIEASRMELDVLREDMDARDQELVAAKSALGASLDKVNLAKEELAGLREHDFTTTEKLEQREQEITTQEQEITTQEQELRKLQRQLGDDKEIVERQKTELNQLKGEMLKQGVQAATPNSADTAESDTNQPLATREAALRDLEATLQAEKLELEGRSEYIQTVEENLINQMQGLTEREAYVEQAEINSGLRVDA
jgi:hypothetical protein